MLFVAAQSCGHFNKVEGEYTFSSMDSPVYFSLDKVRWFRFEYDENENPIFVEFSFEDDGRKQREDDAAIIYRAYGDRTIRIFKELSKRE